MERVVNFKRKISACFRVSEPDFVRTEAELSYEVLEQKNGRAVLRIHLGTGRHHQIRVQLAHAEDNL